MTTAEEIAQWEQWKHNSVRLTLSQINGLTGTQNSTRAQLAQWIQSNWSIDPQHFAVNTTYGSGRHNWEPTLEIRFKYPLDCAQLRIAHSNNA